MYNSYIEGEFEKQKSDRDLWRNKYLYDRSIREVGQNKNYSQAYQSFLKLQIEEKRSKTRNERERIDDRLKNINQGV